MHSKSTNHAKPEYKDITNERWRQICYERERDTKLSCGHSNVCSRCIARVAASTPGDNSPKCPTCRASLELPPILRRPGLKPVRFAAPPIPPPRNDSRRVRSALVQVPRSTTPLRRHSAFESTVTRNHVTPPAPPTPASGRRVVILAQRGVAADSVCTRLRRYGTGTADMHYVWVTVAGGAGDNAVALRVQELAPSVLVLAFDVRKVQSFDAVLRWDSAVSNRLPRIWAALSSRGQRNDQVSLGMTEVRDAAHCLGSRRTTVEVRLGNKVVGCDSDVRRLAEAVMRCFLPPKPPAITNSGPTSERISPWSLIRQCI